MIERSAACITGEISAAVSLMATCCPPQLMHRTSRINIDKVSRWVFLSIADQALQVISVRDRSIILVVDHVAINHSQFADSFETPTVSRVTVS